MNRFTVRHLAVMLYYASHGVGQRSSLLGYVIKQLNHVLTGCDIAWQARIGPGLVLYHPTGVVIGADVVMGRDCVLQQGVTIGGLGGDDVTAESESPTIGNSVRFGPGSRVFGPIAIGDDCVIGANAVVVRDVPPASTAVGVPAVNRPNGLISDVR